MHELFFLIFENMPQGIALFDREINPIVYNPQFMQFSTRFADKVMKGYSGFPQKIITKIKEHANNNLKSSKSIFSITSSDNMVFFLIVTTIHHNSKPYYQVTLHPKRLSEFELYLSLKNQYKINEKEFEIISYVKKGLTNKDIAELIKTSEASVKKYLTKIYQKVEVGNRTELTGILENDS